MSFLSGIVVWALESTLGQAILRLVWDGLSKYVEQAILNHKKNVENQRLANISVDPLLKAKNGEEVEKSADSNLSGV